MTLTATVVDRVEELETCRREWDALAVAAGRPFSAPAWMLAWWRHARSPRALLRAVVVRDGAELAAVAPFFVERPLGRPARYRLLGGGIAHRAEPVARAGAERDAARAIVAALADAAPKPRSMLLESFDVQSEWAALLADSWPGRGHPWSTCEWSAPAPYVSLQGRDFGDWMDAKSRNFRSQIRRLRRRLEGQGARFEIASTEAELEAALEAFSRLHYARWSDRGGTVALSPRIERALADGGRELLGGGRFRVVTIELEGETISAHVFVAAGGEVSYWNGGFDERWAAEKPSMLALVAAVEDAFERSDSRLDLGGGGHEYKYRLADGDDALESTLLVPRDSRYAMTRLQLLPRQLRRELSRRVPADVRDRLHRFRRRVPT